MFGDVFPGFEELLFLAPIDILDRFVVQKRLVAVGPYDTKIDNIVDVLEAFLLLVGIKNHQDHQPEGGYTGKGQDQLVTDSFEHYFYSIPLGFKKNQPLPQ
jgi:hypothetical protein